MRGRRSSGPGLSVAACSGSDEQAILATLPLLIVFFLAQKVFVEGITLTGVKG